MILEGTVAFCNLAETERYNGQDTGKYSVVLVMDDEDAATLENQGVRIKEYQNNKQRKFASKYSIDVLDAEGNVVSKHIPYGSKVRIKWKAGPEHPQWGTSTYLEKIKVLEYAERDDDEGENKQEF